jgi:hypothetical protein
MPGIFNNELRQRSLKTDRRPRSLFKVDMRKRLSAAITHDKAGVQFFEGPGRQETAGRHYGSSDLRG